MQSSTRNPLETTPAANQHKGHIPNTPAASAVIAFCLGGVLSFGLYTATIDVFSVAIRVPYQLGFYIAAWAFFHWAEFSVTAAWNLEKCNVDSYLLENGNLYHIAHSAAVLEYLITRYFMPSLKSYPYISQVGMVMVVLGQMLRSAAMIHASTNFSHVIAHHKKNDHELVTDGIYGWFRHPSYAGFFYWALGTQLLLQNPFSFIFFCVALWKFFFYRIRAEEKTLIKFFGKEYVRYRDHVGTKIPFVP